MYIPKPEPHEENACMHMNRMHACSIFVAEQGDRQLKFNTWHSVKVHVRGQTICVTCDGRAVFTDVDARTADALSGGVTACV